MKGQGQNRLAIRDLQTLFSAGSLGGLSDGQLLERFLSRGTRPSSR